MKFGSQKAFFARIWARLHKSDPSGIKNVKRKGTDLSTKNCITPVRNPGALVVGNNNSRPGSSVNKNLANISVSEVAYSGGSTTVKSEEGPPDSKRQKIT